MNKSCFRLNLAICILALELSSCAGSPPEFAQQAHQVKAGLDVTISSSGVSPQSVLNIQYLGVGGYLFELNGERILTAPFFSNPEFLKNIPGRRIERNDALIEEKLPAVLKSADHNVKAILVGHSHYDHLMDVPYLLDKYLKGVKVYGSTTATAILNNFGITCGADSAASQAISVNANADAGTRIDIEGSNISILPLPSSHAPHVLGITFQKGFYHCGNKFDLKTAADWKMGRVFAYLIDFNDDEGKPLFRIYYQDSASEPNGAKAGLVPQKVIEEKSVDIAILTLAGSHNVARYPESRVINTQAELYVVGHWEDFFGPYPARPVIARGSDEIDFISRLERAIHNNPAQTGVTQWAMPLPMQTITVTR